MHLTFFGYKHSYVVWFVNKSCGVLFFTSALAKNFMSHTDKHAGHTTPREDNWLMILLEEIKVHANKNTRLSKAELCQISLKVSSVKHKPLHFHSNMTNVRACGALGAVAIAGQCKVQAICTSVLAGGGEGGEFCITIVAAILHANLTQYYRQLRAAAIADHCGPLQAIADPMNFSIGGIYVT